MSDTYTCAMCKETFNYAWTREEALQEAELNFGVKEADKDPTMVQICDDCYKKVMHHG